MLVPHLKHEKHFIKQEISTWASNRGLQTIKCLTVSTEGYRQQCVQQFQQRGTDNNVFNRRVHTIMCSTVSTEGYTQLCDQQFLKVGVSHMLMSIM